MFWSPEIRFLASRIRLLRCDRSKPSWVEKINLGEGDLVFAVKQRFVFVFKAVCCSGDPTT